MIIAARARRIPRRPLNGVGVAALAIAVVTGLTGCAAEAGFGLPTLEPESAATVFDAAGAQPSAISGTLAVETNGCFTWRSADGAETDGAWIVWPDGFRQDDDHVVTDTGARIGAGDSVDATGAVVALEDLPDSGEDGYYGSFGRFCDADERGVLVLTDADVG